VSTEGHLQSLFQKSLFFVALTSHLLDLVLLFALNTFELLQYVHRVHMAHGRAGNRWSLQSVYVCRDGLATYMRC